MKQYIFLTLFALLAVFLVSCGYMKLSNKSTSVCDGTYALCTSTHCIPDPNRPDKALCFCTVEKGKSIGYTDCEKRKPQVDSHKVERVISTFSFKEFSYKRTMSCPADSMWANCLDKTCTIDPMHPNRAICSCDLMDKGAFVTLGGGCNTKLCAKGVWSGATPEANKELQDALMEDLNLNSSPERPCQSRKP